jgi:hypothetical protein
MSKSETLTDEQKNEKALSEIDDNLDRHTRRDLEEAKDSRGRAGVAAQIARDRYGAGSTAAFCTISIMLQHGVEEAIEFAKNLRHHEE